MIEPTVDEICEADVWKVLGVLDWISDQMRSDLYEVLSASAAAKINEHD